MVDSRLVDQARRLLDQARMIAEASASQTSPIGANHPESRMPPGLRITRAGTLITTNCSTLELCGRAINQAIANDDDDELRDAIAWCEAELRSLTHSSAHGGETTEERNRRIVRDYEGTLAGVVARQELMSVTMVRKIRTGLGREPRLGRRT